MNLTRGTRHLPPEIIMLIAQNSDAVDLMAFRMTAKTFYRSADPEFVQAYFTNITVFASSHSLRLLNLICESPRLGPHVKRVTLATQILAPHGISTNRDYAEAYADQRKLIDGKAAIQHLTTAFSALKVHGTPLCVGLRDFVQTPKRSESAIGRRSVCRTFNYRVGATARKPLSEALFSALRLSDCRLVDFSFDIETNVVLPARGVRIGRFFYPSGGNDDTWDPQAIGPATGFVLLAHGLHRLSLNCDLKVSGVQSHDILTFQSFAGILGNCFLLEELYVKLLVDVDEENIDDLLRFANDFDLDSAHLRHIHLEGCILHCEGLIDGLEVCTEALRSVKLVNCTVYRHDPSSDPEIELFVWMAENLGLTSLHVSELKAVPSDLGSEDLIVGVLEYSGDAVSDGLRTLIQELESVSEEDDENAQDTTESEEVVVLAEDTEEAVESP